MVISRHRSPIEGPEQALEQLLVASIENLFGDLSHNWWGAASFPVGASRPDILLAAYEPRVRKLVESDPIHIETISYLYAVRWAKAATVSKRTNKPLGKVVSALELLTDWQVTKQASSVYFLDPVWRRVLPRIVSIEVKVKDWKRAIQQAKLNLAFSHESYLALPEPVANRVIDREEFVSTPLGLLSLSRKTCAVLRQAKASSPAVPSYYFKIAAAVAKTN